MAISAADLLRHKHVSLPVRSILNVAATLEQYGAWNWDLRAVALGTLLILVAVRNICHKKRGIDWYALLHGIVSATGALACMYMDFHAKELTGTPEPLRSCQCSGPLTVLHRILPAVTAGYSILDLYDGYYISTDFMLHGIATLAVMVFFCSQQTPHLIEPFLLMEVSTPLLTIVRADFLSPFMAGMIQASFALTFFIFRIVLVPYMWFQLMVTMYQERSNPTYQACMSPLVYPVAMVVGIFFHSLNLFWFIKIVKKAKRKLMGVEGIHAKNDLNEREDDRKKVK
ncbi:hypothetical protein MPSEU_000109900 [Mayamaea pseudoterrestris]|nr:hypothetical protein MPSEU_000109900 [Mayamaea pseudoterrestris]